MPRAEVVFKPKYTGTMLFSMLLYPIWVGLFVYFVYVSITTRSFNPQGFLAVVFGLMSISLPFRVFREIRFADHIIVKRYLLPDIVIAYRDVREIGSFELKGSKASVPLLMMTQQSLVDLEQLLRKQMSERGIKLKKK